MGVSLLGLVLGDEIGTGLAIEGIGHDALLRSQRL